MAKLAGGALGVRRGKVGAEVYTVTGGIQVVKQYQPVVANPNTDGQQLQRIKMMLVGKITKAITPAMLVGLGSRFRARAEFNKVMLRAAQARLSGEQGEWKAYVPPTALVFSNGPAVAGVEAGPASLSANKRTVTLPLTSFPEGWTYFRAIAVAGGARLDTTNDFMSGMEIGPTKDAGTISIELPAPATEGAHVYLMFGRTMERAAQMDRNGGSVVETELSLDGAAASPYSGIEWSESMWIDWVGGTGVGGN